MSVASSGRRTAGGLRPGHVCWAADCAAAGPPLQDLGSSRMSAKGKARSSNNVGIQIGIEEDEQEGHSRRERAKDMRRHH